MAADRPAAPVSPRVLVVDDERKNRELLRIMLEAEGYSILTGSSGEEALAIVERELPDLVLMDVMMPGMDGYQVVARIKRNPLTERIPVVMLSALDDRSSRAHGLSAGARAFLTKPIDRAELCEMVRGLLRETS